MNGQITKDQIGEEMIVTINGDIRYLLYHELTDLIENPDARYFTAIGLYDDDTIDLDDIIFLKNYEENGNQIFEKVSRKDQIFNSLAIFETTIDASEVIPGYAKKLAEAVKKWQESSN